MNKIKIIILFLILAVVVISATVNVSRQFSVLAEAKKTNNNLLIKVNELTEINNDLIDKVAYASSSAYLEEAARDKFGLGSENDVWLELSPEQKNEAVIPTDLVENEPKFQQWFDLFTK